MRILSVILLLLLVMPAAANPRSVACLPTVDKAWLRMAPASMPMGAGFFVIENRCTRPAIIRGVSAHDFASAGMHETRADNGISRMRPIARLVLRAGERVEFRPGARHLMLMQPRRAMTAGTPSIIELQLADGRKLPVTFVVRAAAP